ncbi:hypothetical protein ACGFMO_37305 [Streptomyces niveus]|uniref:hypothetical protein n=1 Tax=Streptomyces niveus TaxID=193462 RepID=UPI003715EBB1
MEVHWLGRIGSPSSRPRATARRTLPAAAAVVALLVGTIGLAGRDDSGDSPDPAASTSATAATVRSERSAADTASRYAVLLGGESMFNPQARGAIVDSIAAPAKRESLRSGFDADYTTAFNKQIGLDAAGRPPRGSDFVNRTMPAGAKVTAYVGDTATVAVWCSGLFGVTGPESPGPESSWFTITLTLQWAEGVWKLVEFEQKDGPEPGAAEVEDFGQAPAL